MNRNLLATLVLLCFCLSILTGTALAKPVQPGTYIVVFENDQDPDAVAHSLRQRYRVQVSGIYRHALRGAVIQATQEQATAVAGDGRVVLVEPNQVYSIDDQTLPTGIARVFADDNYYLNIDGTDFWRVDADVAILDTGIDFDHPDLNLAMAVDCTWSGPAEGTCAGTRDDGHGHGTHVAGTVGALDNTFGVVGVAPGVRLWAVKVLTNYGTGTTAQIVAGIDWVAGHADRIEVANMSLGGVGDLEPTDSMYMAIANATQAGVLFTLSAGNRDMDVADYHPAGHPDAITVSALADSDGEPGYNGGPTCTGDEDDTLADFSNYGTGVDVAAPGVCIYSTYQEGGYATMSGTSMAAPHVAGAAAILASGGIDQPGAIKEILVDAGNFDWTDEAPDGIQEPLLDVSNESVFAPVLVSEPPPIGLTAVGRKVAGKQVTDLEWICLSCTENTFDVVRDGADIVTVQGDAYSDPVDVKGAGMHFYWVCETGGEDVCSGAVMVTY